MQNRKARRLVPLSSKMEVWIKSYARKTGFPGIYSENWREKQVFPDLRANERENRKSKKNHLREIQRAFEWAIDHRLGPPSRRENRERDKKKHT